MKLKVIEILNAVPTLKTLNEARIPINTSMIMMKNMEELKRAVDQFNARRTELFNQYAVLSDPENKKSEKKIPKRYEKKFLEAVEGISDEDVEVDVKTLKLTDLPGVSISSSELSAVKWLIEDLS